jgi:hypothetical protein
MIDEETATSVAFDAGGRYEIPAASLSIGGAVQNVGGDASFISEKFSLRGRSDSGPPGPRGSPPGRDAAR